MRLPGGIGGIPGLKVRNYYCPPVALDRYLLSARVARLVNVDQSSVGLV